MDKFTGLDKNTPVDFDDDLDEILPWMDDPTTEVIDDVDVLIDDEFDDEPVVDAFLSFLDPNDDAPPEFVEAQVSSALEQYTFDEILEENEMEEAEALGILYELGYVGLPEFINEDEEVQDRETEEDE